ncbi:MAG: kelch repeat-containing protein [Pseudomonadota bacterium]
MPLAVQEIYPNALSGRIHLAGGLYAGDGEIRGATDRHFTWAPGENSWTERAPLPQRRHHPNLVGSDDRIFALGGFDTRADTLDWTMTAETLIYNPSADQWTKGPASPEPHGETVCVSIASRIHVIGGRTPKGTSNQTWTDHIDSDRHFVLDGGSWERAAPALVKRNSAAGAVLNDNIHVVGGRQVGGGNLTAHEVYDAREDRWRNAAPMPQGQGGLAAAALGGKLYAFGGEFFDNGGGVYPEAWAYDPLTDQWTAIADMPTPRHGLGAVTLGESIYVIGGAKGVGGRETSSVVEIYRP